MLRRSSGTVITPTLGSIVQNGKFADWAFAFERQLKRVDLPMFGNPTIPHCNAIFSVHNAQCTILNSQECCESIVNVLIIRVYKFYFCCIKRNAKVRIFFGLGKLFFWGVWLYFFCYVKIK